MPAATTTRANSFLQRLIGAAALDSAIYEEVEADRAATWQALGVVVAASVAAGVGARPWGAASPAEIGFYTLVALLAWVAWAVVTFEIGARILPDPETRANVGELLRTTGFAAAPGLLRVFGVLPGVSVPAIIVTALWMLAAMIVAVRQALDYRSTARAVAVCVLGWLLAIAFAVGIGLIFGPAVS
jgi:hypothetical protein